MNGTNNLKWFLRKAQFTKPDGEIRDNNDKIQHDDTYEWTWHGHPDTTAERGVVTEANGKDLFVYIRKARQTVSMKIGGAIHRNERDTKPTPDDDSQDAELLLYGIVSSGWTFLTYNINSIALRAG